MKKRYSSQFEALIKSTQDSSVKGAQRRLVLKGMGLSLGLPLLETLSPAAFAQNNTSPKFALMLATGNGVRQERIQGGQVTEPESFWLRNDRTHNITPQSFVDDGDRSLSVLKSYAKDINIIKGMQFKDGPESACAHRGGSSQLFTGSKIKIVGGKNQPTHASIDQRIADEFNRPGIGPLTAIAGPADKSLTSFSNDGQIRTMQSNPLRNFEQIVGGTGADVDAVTQRRATVNDLLREQLNVLQNNPALSQRDKQKIEAHRDLIQDIEVRACAVTNNTLEDDLNSHNNKGWHTDNKRQIETARLHIDVLTLGMSCGYSNVGVLQLGRFIDSGTYSLGGESFNFHNVSHRTDGDDPLDIHRRMDRHILQQVYAYMLDRIKERGLLNQGMTIWANQQANGNHNYQKVPMIIAGDAGGFLKTGQYIVKNVYNTRILNTILTATGLRKDNGDWIDNFGNQINSVRNGVFDEIIS